MYFGALVMLVGMPLALGSYWGLLAVIPLTLVLVWRLVEEEKILVRDLSGYTEYQALVSQRLLPLSGSFAGLEIGCAGACSQAPVVQIVRCLYPTLVHA